MKYTALQVALQQFIDKIAREWDVPTVQTAIPDTLVDFMTQYGVRKYTAAAYHYIPPRSGENSMIVINPAVLRFFTYPRGTITLLHEFLHYVWIYKQGVPNVTEMKEFEHSAMTEAARVAPDYRQFWQTTVESLLPRSYV